MFPFFVKKGGFCLEQISKLRDFWLNHGDRIEEWTRLKFHTYFVTVLISLNTLLGVSALLTWLKLGFGIPIPFTFLGDISWTSFNILLNLPIITWFYSTITYPIKKGYKVVIDWRATERGRILSFFLNISSTILMLWVAATRYIHEHYAGPLETISLSKKEHPGFLVHDLSSFITLLYIIPLILTLILLTMTYRHFKINEEILKRQFFSWEFKPIARFSHFLVYDSFDVIVGWDKTTKKPLVLKEAARFIHELVAGATGSGKTSTTLLLRIAQDLVKIARGIPGGIVLLEPKGDAVDDVLKLAKKSGVPDEKILVIDPTKSNSTKFNPFSGPLDAAAASFTGTLNSLTGDQDAFFKGQQEETATLYTMLAKLAFPEIANITTLQRMYQDPRYLANVTESVRKNLDRQKSNPDLSPEDKNLLERYERVVRYFEDEVLDYKTYRDKEEIRPLTYPDDHRYAGKQIVESKKDKYVSGAKKYLNDIAMNSLLSDLMVAQDGEKVLDLDEFLRTGGVLLVNTALGDLDELSLLFGQFFIRQFQSAVFRRPKDGEEITVEGKKTTYKRIPIFFTIDEFPLYVNQSFERMLTLGRSYNVGAIIAIQSLGQLDAVIPGYRQTIMGNASTKTVFGRGPTEDNKIFSETFLEEETYEESLNESSTPVTVENQTWGLRHNTQKMLKPKFSPSDIASLPFKHMIVQMVNEDNSLDDARLSTGAFVSEAKFLKKYFRKIELASEKSEELEIGEILEKTKYSIESSEHPPKVEEQNQTPPFDDIEIISEREAEDNTLYPHDETHNLLEGDFNDQVDPLNETFVEPFDEVESNTEQNSNDQVSIELFEFDEKVEETVSDKQKATVNIELEQFTFDEEKPKSQLTINFDSFPENLDTEKETQPKKLTSVSRLSYKDKSNQSVNRDEESLQTAKKEIAATKHNLEHSIPDSETDQSINELIKYISAEENTVVENKESGSEAQNTNEEVNTKNRDSSNDVLPKGVMDIKEEVVDDL